MIYYKADAQRSCKIDADWPHRALLCLTRGTCRRHSRILSRQCLCTPMLWSSLSHYAIDVVEPNITEMRCASVFCGWRSFGTDHTTYNSNDESGGMSPGKPLLNNSD